MYGFTVDAHPSSSQEPGRDIVKTRDRCVGADYKLYIPTLPSQTHNYVRTPVYHCTSHSHPRLTRLWQLLRGILYRQYRANIHFVTINPACDMTESTMHSIPRSSRTYQSRAIPNPPVTTAAYMHSASDRKSCGDGHYLHDALDSADETCRKRPSSCERHIAIYTYINVNPHGCC